MPISDDEYRDWLRDDAAIRVVLVNLYVYSVDDEAEVVRRLSSRPFIATLPESPPSKAVYDDRLIGSPTISRRLGQAFIGEADASWGSIDIDNTDGALDDWLDDYWDGRRVDVMLGDWSWDYSDFIGVGLVFVGVAADIQVRDDNSVALTIRGKRDLLDRPVQTELISGTGTANDGEPWPLLYGYCYNVEPRLIDEATLKFVVHHGTQMNSTGTNEVRDNGLPVGSHTKNGTTSSWDGTFTLGQDQVGRITCDFRGGRDQTGTVCQWISQILRELIEYRGVLDASEIDSSFWTRLHDEETEFHRAGIYIRDRMTLAEVLQLFSGSMRIWYGFSRTGLLTGGIFRTPADAGDSVMTIEADDVAQRGIRHVGRILPATSVRVGYLKNWTVQDPDSLAEGVGAAERAKWSQPYQGIVTDTNDRPAIDQHLLAVEPPLVDTLLAIEGGINYGAVGEARAYMGSELVPGLWSDQRDLYEVDTFAVGFDLELGDKLTLDYPRFGFDGGADAIVVGITLRLLSKTTTLELWK